MPLGATCGVRFYAFIVFCLATARLCAGTIASRDGSAVEHHHRHHHRHRPLGLAHRSAALRHTATASQHSEDQHIAAASEEKLHKNAAEGTASGKVVDVVAGVSADQRPIITGCLKKCGYEEQACVTQCQVCIEQNECRILGKCDPCLQAANAQKMAAQKTDTGILDAGGVSMMRDGFLAEMTRAKLESLERKRKLISARAGVLNAQREAEWAAEERHMSAKHLEEDRQALKGARLEVTRWKLQNEKKLKTMRAKAREQRVERQKAEQKLEVAKRKYSKAQKRLRIASNTSVSESESNTSSSQSDPSDADDEASDDTAGETEGEEVWKLAKDVEQKQQGVERAEMEVEKTSADAEWLDRGLRRRVKATQTAARKAREELLEARARERVSRERLEDAKKNYIAAVQSSQWADKAAEDAERKLRKAPVSPYNSSQNTTSPDKKKDQAHHSSAPSVASRAWFPLFALLAVSRAAWI